MRAQIYLHIGWPKTGTTSIQRVLAENRDTLLSYGVNFFPGRENQGWLISSLLAPEPHKTSTNLKRRVDTPEKAKPVNEAFSKQLTTWLEENTSPKMVISAEVLSRLSEQQLTHFKQLLAPYAAAYRIIVYVRHPYDFANSAALQRLKGGGAILGKPDWKVSLPEYRRRLSRHIQVFGRENVDIRMFSSQSFVEGDLISDFMAALDLPTEAAAACQAIRLNESMSHEAAIILAQINRMNRHATHGRLRGRTTSFPAYASAIRGQKFFIDPKEYSKHEPKICADIEWLNQTLGAPVFGFTPPPPASQALWKEETLESIRSLVAEMTAEFDRLRHYAPKTKFPSISPTLAWLQPSAGSGQSAPLASAPPNFDEKTVLELASFFDNLAGAIQKMRAAEIGTRSRLLVWTNPRKARAHFKEIVLVNPANVRAQFRLSQAYALCGNFADAHAAAKVATEMAPEHRVYKRWFAILNFLVHPKRSGAPGTTAAKR